MKMADKKENFFGRLAHIARLTLRPSYAFRRLREVTRELRRHRIKNDIPLDSLPEVKLIEVSGNEELERRLVNMYDCNPSTLVSGPMEWRALKEKQANNFEFYLVINGGGNEIGAIAFDNSRSMICHLVIDFRLRSKGLGISAMMKLEKIKIKEGIDLFWGQAYKNNPRILSVFLSLGYKIIKEESTAEYYTVKKTV
jgi:hypothetical protein